LFLYLNCRSKRICPTINFHDPFHSSRSQFPTNSFLDLRTAFPVSSPSTAFRARRLRVKLPREKRICLICQHIPYQPRYARQLCRFFKHFIWIYGDLTPPLFYQCLNTRAKYAFCETGPSNCRRTLGKWSAEAEGETEWGSKATIGHGSALV
jgi:hypothetical protein